MLKIINLKKFINFSLLMFLAVIILIYNFIFSSYFWNHFIKNKLNDIYKENLIIDYKIQEISLFRGLEVDDILIHDKITNTPILLLKKLKLKYFLLGILNGDIGIKEFTLIEPQIYLYKENERWNYESFGTTTKEEELDQKQKKPLPESINLYVPIRLFFYSNIENLRFYYKVVEKKDNIEKIIEELELKEISLVMGLITKRFKNIDLNYKITTILEDFLISFNPQSEINVIYKKNFNLEGKPALTIHLYKSNLFKNQFLASIKIHTNNLSISKQNKAKEIITQSIWNIEYIPQEKKFQINEISLKNSEGYLFFLNGELKYLNNDWYISLIQKEVEKNQFHLSSYGEVLSILTNNQIQLNGLVSIEKLHLQGKLSELNIDILTNIPFFRFNNHYIQNFNLKLNGILDLRYYLSFLYETIERNNKNNLVFDFIKILNLENLSLSYNKSYIKIFGAINETINLTLNVNNFNIGQFLNPHLNGTLNTNLAINSNYDFSLIQLGGNLNLLNTRYSIDDYFSKDQHLYLFTNGVISRNENETKISINIERLSANTLKDNAPFIEIRSTIDLLFGKIQNYKVNLKQFDINYLLLEERLPVNLKANLLSVRNLFLEGLKLSGDIDLSFSNSNIYISNLNLLLPSLHPSGIQILLHVEQSENLLKFHQVSISGWYNALGLKLNGALYKKQNTWEPDIKLFLNYQNPQISEIYKNIFIGGRILLEVNLNKQILNGNLNMNHFHFKYKISCDKINQELCPYYEIYDLNLKLPFHHNLNQPSQITYQSYKDINLPERNFTIRAIKSNYSLDNAYFENGFYFLGSPFTNAIEGYIEYKNNILWIPYLKFFSVFKNQFNGVVELSNFYLNLSDLQPENMQMAGKLYILNFDLNALFPKAKSVFKGSVSGFFRFQSNNFQNLLNHLEVKVSLYQISKDFAGFVVRIIAPTIVAVVVNNLLTINGIDFELKNGLVYSNIIVKSSGFFSLSRIIQPSENEIKQERIPLMEFLKRSEREVKKELE